MAALKALGDAARNGTGNLLTLSIEATRARATVGEISSALEGVYGRYQATIRSIAGVYASEWEGDQGLERIRTEIASFAEDEGRRPRLMVVKMGQDGHDRGAKVIATAFADLGFDVDIGPLFQTPEEAARAAIENDVHVIGVSSQAAGHKTLVPQLIEELAKQGGSEVLVVVGGVIPAQDYDFLKKAGVAAIYGPGTNIPAAASRSCRSCASAARRGLGSAQLRPVRKALTPPFGDAAQDIDRGCGQHRHHEQRYAGTHREVAAHDADEKRRRAQHPGGPSGPPLVSTDTMVKPAKLPIREKITVRAMMLRIIGQVT